jgi:hypothetical protein
MPRVSGHEYPSQTHPDHLRRPHLRRAWRVEGRLLEVEAMYGSRAAAASVIVVRATGPGESLNSKAPGAEAPGASLRGNSPSVERGRPASTNPAVCAIVPKASRR